MPGVTICHSKTLDLAEVTRQADIVICATGRARAFGAEYFTEGQIVLDVGINFDAEGHMCGDVDFEAVEPIVAAITAQFLAGSDRSLPLAPWSTRFVLQSAARAKECVWS